MAVAVLPYAVEHYNTLPELHAARNEFESKQASKILYTELGKVFVTHHVEYIVGIILLHNHFFLEPYEKLVSVNSAAVPWDNRSSAKESADITATAWRFIDNGIAPYEFTYGAPKISFDCQRMQAFLLELGAVLRKWSLTDVLSIYYLGENSIDRSCTTEFTSGRANITLPSDISPDDGNVVDAMWQFRAESTNVQGKYHLYKSFQYKLR